MDATYITNYATTFTSGGQTYNNPVYNLAVGYGLGYMELYAGYASNSGCLLYTSPSPRDGLLSRMPSSA